MFEVLAVVSQGVVLVNVSKVEELALGMGSIFAFYVQVARVRRCCRPVAIAAQSVTPGELRTW